MPPCQAQEAEAAVAAAVATAEAEIRKTHEAASAHIAELHTSHEQVRSAGPHSQEPAVSLSHQGQPQRHGYKPVLLWYLPFGFLGIGLPGAFFHSMLLAVRHAGGAMSAFTHSQLGTAWQLPIWSHKMFAQLLSLLSSTTKLPGNPVCLGYQTVVPVCVQARY